MCSWRSTYGDRGSVIARNKLRGGAKMIIEVPQISANWGEPHSFLRKGELVS